MANQDENHLEIVTWKKVRNEVSRVDKTLADIIDKIDPSKKYSFVKAPYRFGDLIVKDGITQLPGKNKILLPLGDANLDQSISGKLNYSSIPLFLTLKRSNEVFIDTGLRTIPLNLFSAGSLLGLFESIDFLFANTSHKPSWCVSAGARNLFCLPKLNEISGLSRLRDKYKIPADIHLKNLSDQWSTFRHIANHPSFPEPWENIVLFFTAEWFENFNNPDPNWMLFYNYLFSKAWQQSKFAMSKIDLGLNWESFVDAVSSRHLKPALYLADQLRHLLCITAGQWPGFRPADNSQDIAPTTGLQEAILETYLLKHYWPTLMHIFMANPSSTSPVYYSLFFSTLLEGSPDKKNTSTIMKDQKYIKFLFETLDRSFDMNGKFKYEFLKETRFDYFHVEKDQQGEIQSSQLIPLEDPTFNAGMTDHTDRAFCSTSPFWRGCIRIWASQKK
jgi:hypothetical protein